MSYRIEVTKDNRKAGCVDSVCKNEKVKILKGELRLGTWVEMPQFNSASWKWRHWGCTSGAILGNIRTALKKNNPDGDYQWEFMDGLEECEPDVQEKFKTAIIEGKIADEDFKGDPEMNHLGQKGIHKRATPKKSSGSKSDDDDEEEAEQTPAPKKKRERAKKEQDEDVDTIVVEPPKKRAKKVKTEDDEEGKKAPSKKASAKKAIKEESDEEEDVIPQKKVRGKKVVKKDEPEAEKEAETIPTKKPRGQKAVKEEEDAKPAPKSRAKKIKKQEESEDESADKLAAAHGSSVKKEDRDSASVKKEAGDIEERTIVKAEADPDTHVKPAKKSRAKKAPKEEADADSDSDIKPAKKFRATKPVKKEADADSDSDIKPSEKSRAKKAIKQEDALADPATKSLGSEISANPWDMKSKEESLTKVDLNEIPVKPEDELVPGINNETLRDQFLDALEERRFAGGWNDYIQKRRDDLVPADQRPKKAAKGKKTSSAAVGARAKSTRRSSRSNT